MENEPTDPIAPAVIEHGIDEIWVEGQLEQFYNFLDYHFEQPGAYLRARAYLDDVRVVTLFGPFEQRGSITATRAPEFEAAAVAYLSRRFHKVQRR